MPRLHNELVMIAYLKGVLQDRDGVWHVINVRDVGYSVLMPASYAQKLAIGEECAIHVLTIVREDQISLYGFLTRLEKQWFSLLLDVQGVGGKLALSILTTLSCAQIENAIKQKDRQTLEAVSGLGGRLAERLMRELYDKVWKMFDGAVVVEDTGDHDILQDVCQALGALGYKAHEVKPICQKVLRDTSTMSVEDVIREVLKRLG